MADIKPSRPDPSARSRRPIRTREVLFALLGLPLALICFVCVFVTLYAGTALGLTVVGLPVLAGGLRGCRWLGGVHRRLVRRVFRQPVGEPVPAASTAGIVAWARAALTDSVSWRSMAYLALRLPVAALGFLAAAGLPVAAIWLLGFPFWIRAIAAPGDAVTPLWTAVIFVPLGLLLAFAVPPAMRATGHLNRLIADLLLGPSPAQERLGALTQARGALAAESTRSLQWIERDLHDGTQAELVAIAMTLSLAEDELLTRPALDGDRLPGLLERAQRQTGDAIAGLRRITTGINPVALDGGLGAALAVLVVGCPVLATLDLDLGDVRPDPSIERVVYFCVAELLTNVAKHSNAIDARVAVRARGGLVLVEVSDDGRGGALAGVGSGLTGLAERLSAVDGTISLDSPPGGGTVATVRLPTRI